MNLKKIEGMLLEKFPDAPVTRDGTGLTGAQWSIVVPISGINDAAKAFETADFFLESITALDFEDTFELVYHFNCYEPYSRLARTRGT
jgi:NADH-quinone oxidoreductase subunit C